MTEVSTTLLATIHTMTSRAAFQFLVIAALLGLAAATAPTPQSSDRDIYQKIGQHLVVLDCQDVHCFRVLVAPLLERLPGPSLVKWKIYAVAVSAAAAMATTRLCLILGLSVRAARLAPWVVAFGFGPLQAVFDSYTSDPLMYLLGPLLAADLLQGRLLRPGVMASIGVLAKEFAAAPLWIFTLLAGLQRRWDMAVRTLLAATTATLLWLTLQTWLMTMYNYSYGTNPSVRLASGGYFAVWASALGWRQAAVSLFMTFGPLYLLMPAGLMRAGRTLRLLALSSLPAVAAFVYVQQPDRALWNFHFVVIPIVVPVLLELPDALCWLFVVCYGVANLRLGDAQPQALVWIRGTALAISLALAMVAVAALRNRRGGEEPRQLV
jgi:hypothetical protein